MLPPQVSPKKLGTILTPLEQVSSSINHHGQKKWPPTNQPSTSKKAATSTNSSAVHEEEKGDGSKKADEAPQVKEGVAGGAATKRLSTRANSKGQAKKSSTS